MRCAECDCEKGDGDCNWIASPRTIVITPPTKDQEEYLRRIEEATGKYDPNYVIGGPKQKKP